MLLQKQPLQRQTSFVIDFFFPEETRPMVMTYITYLILCVICQLYSTVLFLPFLSVGCMLSTPPRIRTLITTCKLMSTKSVSIVLTVFLFHHFILNIVKISLSTFKISIPSTEFSDSFSDLPLSINLSFLLPLSVNSTISHRSA